MAAEPNIPRFFTELQLAGEEGDFDNGLKIAERILSLVPDDKEALHCKVVCLVQQSKFQEAVKVIDAASKKSEKQLYLFEKAYCLYRLEKYSESRHLLQKLPQNEQRVRELLAQVSYRLESYDETRSIYATLVKECSDDFDNEREANYVAGLALSSKPDELTHLESLRADTMEQSFNQACCYLAMGRGGEAERLLRKGEELGRESLQEEDYTEEEIESELSAIRIQLGYALQIQDKGKDALGVYNAVLKQKPSDVSHAVVASNNVIVLNRDRDIFDSKKKARVLANEGGSRKLTRSQKLPILYNRCLFALQTNQLDQCRELVSALRKVHHGPSRELVVLAEVALLNREKKTTACLELLETQLQKDPESDILLYITLAQLYFSQGEVSKVCSVLHSIPNVARHLGVVAALVSLYSNAGNVDRAVEVLDDAVSWWAKLPKSEAVQHSCRSLMMENAQYKMQHSKPEAAVLVLEKLQADYPSDLKVLAMLISAYSKFDSRKAEELSRSLPTLETTSAVDVDALEQMPSFRHTRRQLLKPESEKPSEKKEFVPKDKKKKRKPKLPKNYDPSVPPDPERWLPLRERSYFRKGKRKGFLGMGRGTQGATAASASAATQLDASKQKPEGSKEAATGLY